MVQPAAHKRSFIRGVEGRRTCFLRFAGRCGHHAGSPTLACGSQGSLGARGAGGGEQGVEAARAWEGRGAAGRAVLGRAGPCWAAEETAATRPPRQGLN